MLCTSDKTYDLRQVSTSNTVYVAQSTNTSDDDGGLPRPILEAIAQPQSTLEVVPMKNASAVPHILAILPTYTSTGHYSSRGAISKEQLFANVPLSDAECEQAWSELSCFELAESGNSVIPSASVKLRAWRAMLSAATATGVDLSQPLNAHDRKSLTHSDLEVPDELNTALLRSMGTSDTPDIVLDETRCAKVVGHALLKDRTDNVKGSISTATFKSEWADLLPEKWRNRAELSLLNGHHRLESGSKEIVYVEQSADLTAAGGPGSGDVKATLGAKRKWHEKFRAAKKSA